MDGLFADVGLVGWLVGKVTHAMNQIQVKQLAAARCPSCSSVIGLQEAEAAYDRAHQFASDHSWARSST